MTVAPSEQPLPSDKWFGVVPSDWTTPRLATLFREVDRPADPKLPVLSVSIHSGISDNELSDEERDRKVNLSEDRSKYQRVQPGDLVYNMMRAWQGAFGTVTVDGLVSPAYVVAQPKTSFRTRFVELLLQTASGMEEVRRFSKGIADFRMRLYWEHFRNIVVCLPPLVEQDMILAWLDGECGRIDRLIEKKRRFIELLCEKQIAAITSTVVSGLRPDATKQALVPWIPESPAHWSVLPLTAIASRGNGLFIDGDWIESKDLAEEGIRYITTGNVGRGFYKEQGSGFISEATFQRLNCTDVLPGDILISRLNSPIARACVVPDLKGRVITSVDNVIVRPSSAYDRRFLVYLLSCAPHFFNTENLARGTTMQRISRSALGRIRFAVPDLTEQSEIADHLDREIESIQRLVSTTERSIKLLEEHRAALIATAITGKVDIRGKLKQNMKAAA